MQIVFLSFAPCLQADRLRSVRKYFLCAGQQYYYHRLLVALLYVR